MQVHLDVEHRRETGRSFAHGKLGGFVGGQGEGASKLDEEQVVLNQVLVKGRFVERTVCHPFREGMLGVGPPLGGRRRLQTLEEAHGLLPDWLLSECLRRIYALGDGRRPAGFAGGRT
jgi:hypothetical protein